jgi:hypothetical protein
MLHPDPEQHPDSLTKFTDPDPRGSKTYGLADPDLAPEDDNLKGLFSIYFCGSA